jgi:hypothetical protein
MITLNALAVMIGVMCAGMIVVMALTPREDYRDDLDDLDDLDEQDCKK